MLGLVGRDAYRALAVVAPAGDEGPREVPIEPKPLPREFPEGWRCGLCGHEPIELVVTSDGPRLFCSWCESVLASQPFDDGEGG